MDEDFWRQVERARRMTPEQKIRESLQLFDRVRSTMLAGIRSQYPHYDEHQVHDRFLECLLISRRVEASR